VACTLHSTEPHMTPWGAASKTARSGELARGSDAAVLHVATFNAGLAIGVLPHVTERLPHVIEALAALEVDLLFVQEFWLERHWEALKEAIVKRLPVALRVHPLGGATRPCTEAQLAPLVRCASQRCAGLHDEALASCVVQHCARLALQLPSDCLNCIASNPEGDLTAILARCTGGGAEPALVPAGPVGSGELMAYGGSFGTGLLLRQPPLASGSITFESTVNARGAMYVQLAGGLGAGPLHVFGAHLSPGGAEQVPQVEQLLDFIDEKAGAEPALLLGDLNLVPGSALLGRIARAGFHEGQANDHRSTYSGQALLGGTFAGSGWRLDHVLVRGTEAQLRTQRILDQPVRLAVEGREVISMLSDHAGLLSTIAPGPTSKIP
jgi:endonuclease/exonuclease/phosphatase family metal-dependent hydrolase